MPSKISPKIREAVERRAGKLCEYCRISETSGHYKHQVDHIFPRKHGGTTILENLALACWRCNLAKGADIGSYDFASNGEFVPFFNPRTQIWTEHFRLDGAEIIALTAEARITARIFRLNDAERIEERAELIKAKLFE